MARTDQSLSREKCTSLVALAARYRLEHSGSVGFLFAIMFMTVMLITAVAIDYGRTELEWQRIQHAADSAALAASHRLGTADQDESGMDVAQRFFKANTGGRDYEPQIVLDSDRGEVRVTAAGSVGTSLLNAVGVRNMAIRASSRVVKGDGTVEVALVLDNSGSMAGQPIADLISASKSMSGVVMSGADNSDRVSVAIVPFSGAVNVGAGYRDADWIDSSGASPLNGANFATNVPRLQMFDRVGVSWRGCVEARSGGLDMTDTTADAANPATLFVPMFAPDEPDSDNNGGASYSNNYIPDDGGACTPQPVVCVTYDRRGRCTKSQKTPLPADEAQSRICKYDGAVVPVGTAGPNYMCDSQAILPLSSSLGEIESALDAMIAKGSTNIAEGVMWGWRVLSPGAPFTEGRTYDTPKNDKIMVVMTDGANTYSAYSNHNKSWYAAHGYGASGRLGTTYSSSAYVSRMNQKTTAACSNAKAAGIKIYTIAFRLESDPTTLALLQSCASDASMAFRAADGAALITVFEHIGGQISKLRVAG
jgi:Flp pilus assembly protein TadG